MSGPLDVPTARQFEGASSRDDGQNVPVTDHADVVPTAYGARADEYIAALGSIDHAAPLDRAFIERWAKGLDGAVIDVGCGPGQWTHHLVGLGVDAEGIDPAPEFVEHARATYPGVRYRVGQAESLRVADGALGGVLAWYSLIHTPPPRMPAILAEFARCIRPGGRLALGVCTGYDLEPFDHAITTAYYWPINRLTTELESAGFSVTHIETRQDPGARAHGALLAERRPSRRDGHPPAARGTDLMAG